jgi:hypothetical protein
MHLRFFRRADRPERREQPEKHRRRDSGGQTIGGRFFISGAPVPTAANNGITPGFTTVNEAGQPIGFRPLNSLARIFPISEATSFFSVRGDHQINQSNQLTMRFGFNPERPDGIQDESQNQVLGTKRLFAHGHSADQGHVFRHLPDLDASSRVVNEARFNFGRRKAKFDSQVPGAAIRFPARPSSARIPSRPLTARRSDSSSPTTSVGCPAITTSSSARTSTSLTWKPSSS